MQAHSLNCIQVICCSFLIIEVPDSKFSRQFTVKIIFFQNEVGRGSSLLPDPSHRHRNESISDLREFLFLHVHAKRYFFHWRMWVWKSVLSSVMGQWSLYGAIIQDNYVKVPNTLGMLIFSGIFFITVPFSMHLLGIFFFWSVEGLVGRGILGGNGTWVFCSALINHSFCQQCHNWQIK